MGRSGSLCAILCAVVTVVYAEVSKKAVSDPTGFGQNDLQLFKPRQLQQSGVQIAYGIIYESSKGSALGRRGIAGIQQTHNAVEEGPCNVPVDVAVEDVREPGLACS